MIFTFNSLTHGVDGDSASITIAAAVISALEEIPIRQDLAMTGSLSVGGTPMGVTAKMKPCRLGN